MWKSSKTLKTKFPQGFIKIVLSTNIWVWIFNSFCGQKKRGKEERKKRNKKGWEEERKGKQEGRQEGRKEGMGEGERKEKMPACSTRISLRHTAQSTHDLHSAKSSGILSLQLSYPTTEFDTVLSPSLKYFLYQDTAFLWFSNCITGHFFFASLSSSRTSPWLLNGEMPLSAFLGISPLPTPSPPPRWCLFSRLTTYWQQLSNSTFRPDLSPDLISSLLYSLQLCI